MWSVKYPWTTFRSEFAEFLAEVQASRERHENLTSYRCVPLDCRTLRRSTLPRHRFIRYLVARRWGNLPQRLRAGLLAY